MKRNLKIMFTVTNSDLAGAPIYVRDLILYLVSNFDVEVLAVFGMNGPVKSQLDSMGIRTKVIETISSNYSIFSTIHSIFALSKIVSEFNPEIIHSNSSKAGFVSRILRPFYNSYHIYTIHGWGFGRGRRFAQSLFVYLIELFLVRFTDYYVSVSQYDNNIGRKYLRIKENRIFTVHNGIKGSAFNPKYSLEMQKPLVVVMVARVSYQKDYDTLFQACVGFNIKIICVGQDTDSSDLRARVKSYGISSTMVEFVGSSNQVESYLQRADLFCLSSRYEGLPISIIEALRSGLPIAASDVGGVSELVISGYNGFLFTPEKKYELAKIFQYYINNRNVLREHGLASRQLFDRHFCSDVTYKKLLAVYEVCLKTQC